MYSLNKKYAFPSRDAPAKSVGWKVWGKSHDNELGCDCDSLNILQAFKIDGSNWILWSIFYAIYIEVLFALVFWGWSFSRGENGETIKATHPMHFFMRTAETPEARFRHFAALDVKNLRFFVDATLVDATFGK